MTSAIECLGEFLFMIVLFLYTATGVMYQKHFFGFAKVHVARLGFKLCAYIEFNAALILVCQALLAALELISCGWCLSRIDEVL